MGAVLDVLQKRLELRPAMIFQFEPALGAAPRLVRPDVAALHIALRRPPAQVGEVTKRRGALFGRFLGASQIPFFAYPSRHSGAEAQAADKFVPQTVLFQQVKVFAAGGVAPTEDFEIGKSFLDQDFDRLDAHAESVKSKTICQLFIARNLADDELRSPVGNGRPRTSAVVAGQRNRQHGNSK